MWPARTADREASRKGRLKGGPLARMPALRWRQSEKRRKGVFCGAGLEVTVGCSVVVDYVEVWGRAAPVFHHFGAGGLVVFQVEQRGGGVARGVEGGEGFDFGCGGGWDEFLAEVDTELGRGEAAGMREGEDKRARIFDH